MEKLEIAWDKLSDDDKKLITDLRPLGSSEEDRIIVAFDNSNKSDAILQFIEQMRAVNAEYQRTGAPQTLRMRSRRGESGRPRPMSYEEADRCISNLFSGLGAGYGRFYRNSVAPGLTDYVLVYNDIPYAQILSRWVEGRGTQIQYTYNLHSGESLIEIARWIYKRVDDCLFFPDDVIPDNDSAKPGITYAVESQPPPPNTPIMEPGQLRKVHNSMIFIRGPLTEDLKWYEAEGATPDAPSEPASPPPSSTAQTRDIKAEAEKRIIASGKRVTQKRIDREIQNIQIEKMMDVYDLPSIASRLGMEMETVRSRIKNLRKSKKSP